MTRTLTPEHIAKMQAGRVKRVTEDRRKIILEIVTRPGKACSCGITENTTDKELRAMGAGCSAPWFVCPTLDAIRRML